MASETKTRRWGHSLGVVIPREVERLRLKPGDNVVIEVHKKDNPLKELWGAFKFKKDPHKLIKEMGKKWEGKWLR